MIARVVNRVLVFMLGVTLAAAGLFIGIEAVWTWTGSGFLWIHGQAWLRTIESTAWSYNLSIAISIGLAIVGLILLASEIRPHRRSFAIYETSDENLTIMLNRRSTERHLSRRMQALTAISQTRVTIDPARLRWKVRVRAEAARSTRPTLEAAVIGELEQLRAPRPRLRIKTTGKPT